MPTKASTSARPKPLPNFAEFCRNMKPYLDRVRPSDVDQILRSLYRAAKMKVRFEKERFEAEVEEPALRSDRKKLAQTKALINEALELLKKVEPEFREYLTVEREIDGDVYEFPFGEIVEFVADAAQCASTFERVFAGYVHPDLRTKAEKHLAKQRLPRLGRVLAGEVERHTLTGRSLSRAIDQFFMSVAAKCLDQGKDVKGKKIPNYEKLINKAFEALGDRLKTEGAIRKELTRQKKRPNRVVLLDPEDNQWLCTLGQKSTPGRSGTTKLSGQKQTK